MLLIEMIDILILFALNWITRSVVGSTHARYYKYPQLNTPDCGYSRLTTEVTSDCFTYNKQTVAVRHGRNVTLGEAPWVAYLWINRIDNFGYQTEHPCSGSVIADQWIITAAHCVEGKSREIKVLLGRVVELNISLATKVYHGDMSTFAIHEEHRQYTKGEVEMNWAFNYYDLAIFKLTEPIEKYKTPDEIRTENSICLPQKDIFNREPEMVMVSGWSEAYLGTNPVLQMGYRRLIDYSFATKRIARETGKYEQEVDRIISYYTIFDRKIDNHSVMCYGDSGSPMWQYDQGRAILIGVRTGGSEDDGKPECEDDFDYSYTYGARVSSFIDWIQNKTQLQ